MRKGLVLFGIATLCAAHIAVTDTRAELLHERGAGYVVIACLGTAFMLSLNTSWAWLCAAGGLANLFDVRDGSIEDPFMVTLGSSYVAFNLADICVLVGLVGLLLRVVRGPREGALDSLRR